jgi:hypothetical protein
VKDGGPGPLPMAQEVTDGRQCWERTQGHRKIQGGTMTDAMLNVLERKYHAAKKAVV